MAHAPNDPALRQTPASKRFATRELAGIFFDRYRHFSGGRVPENQVFRTIVLIGAGVSHAACRLPLGKDLARAVEEAVVKVGVPRGTFERELDRLEQVYHLPRDDFETWLHALHRFAPGTVIQVLCEQCDVAHYPSLSTETLGHMMKHGFVDAIISCNFDELLEQTLDDEVGPDGYIRIVHDGEWGRKQRIDGRDRYRFSRPLLIKPHGTASEPTSLRFTRELYFELPPDMARLLNTLISGAPANDFVTGGTEPQSKPRPVCFLVLGHSLKSFELNIFIGRCPRGSRLFIAEFGKGTLSGSRSEWPQHMRSIARGRSIPIGDAEEALDHFMCALWGAIEREATGK
jgi:hypothetical protein